ncbi:MAG: GAF domain-containing sensor histidine kinase [Chloroflexi bacterium]|nr:GAF domain-containing sensor histidine kinase [Chloroflexota bacterium]
MADSKSTATPAHISSGLQATLQHIVDDVVSGLGCVGAMVATLEVNNTLPVRAYSVDIAPNLIKQLESKLGLSFIGPKSVAYLDDKKFQENLGVRAVKGNNGHPERFIVSDSLYDLFRPVVSKPLALMAQQATGIKQVIAVPFFLEDEVVGNLFAAARTEFSPRDIDFLTAYGRQAATAIQSQHRLAEAQALEKIIFDLQASLTDENRAFKVITDAVVESLGYVAAAVAPRIGNIMPVRAYSVNSNLISRDFIDTWQRRLGFELLGEKAVAYLDREDYAEQLSVRAIKSEQVQVSDSLYDLVRPVVPRLPILTIQKLLGIKQVISIPFFLEGEAIGNLYVVSQRSRFSMREQEVLQAFGQHAAISLRNARLYRNSENLRETAQIFAKMAFSSAAYVHALRNHIGAFRMYTQLIEPELNESYQTLGENVIERLNQATDILDNLHEPWRQQPDSQTDVNQCLCRAIDKIVPNRYALETGEGITLHTTLAENLPPVHTSPDMLTEAFRILVKNALEAIRDKIRANGAHGDLWVESRLDSNATVEVFIRDNGVGIKPEHLGKIFEIKWSTKDIGMGFGLFWTKDYIEGMGGSIKVESVWREGASFQVNLLASSGR